ncbi:DarT ssDNA thymidine ADP-ribosyltransferase family protein [Peribacillus simplex]
MENAVKKRGVEFLVHFTQMGNLENILTHGILPVSDLEGVIEFNQNDNNRFDDCRDASCFSIEFPNYKYFYPQRIENPGVDWVVLGIRREVLWEKDCLFCNENAASNNVRFISRDDRRGIQAFHGMYGEFPGKPSRQQLGIRDSYPTNPQAEVLVIGEIEPRYIMGVAFENDKIMEKYNHLIPKNIKSIVFRDYFYGRSDYKYWGNGVLNG